MEDTNTMQLRDADVYPCEEILKKTLGRAYASYHALLDLFSDNEMTHEWRFYRDGKAWLCKVQKKRKTIVWMSAWKGFMKATIYFPQRLMDQVVALDISDELKEILKNAAAVGTLRACVFSVRNKRILQDFTTVMQFKITAK